MVILQFITMDDSEEITNAFIPKKWPPFLSDEKFGKWLTGKFFEQNNDPHIPESKVLASDSWLWDSKENGVFLLRS